MLDQYLTLNYLEERFLLHSTTLSIYCFYSPQESYTDSSVNTMNRIDWAAVIYFLSNDSDICTGKFQNPLWVMEKKVFISKEAIYMVGLSSHAFFILWKKLSSFEMPNSTHRNTVKANYHLDLFLGSITVQLVFRWQQFHLRPK